MNITIGTDEFELVKMIGFDQSLYALKPIKVEEKKFYGLEFYLPHTKGQNHKSYFFETYSLTEAQATAISKKLEQVMKEFIDETNA